MSPLAGYMTKKASTSFKIPVCALPERSITSIREIMTRVIYGRGAEMAATSKVETV